jgi:DNA-binding winged helix-turn-helix (wHTH) protein/tetratricopeptide (TPR) repeat protein
MDRQARHLLGFGPFLIDLEERVLMRDHETIALSPKAFETLLVLVQHSERVVLKDDLMKTLWPDTFVEESNLSQHIFQLRKALGDKAHDPEYIVTVPGRGYRFAQKVAEITEPDADLIVQSRSVQRVTVEETASTQDSGGVGSFSGPSQSPWNSILEAEATAEAVPLPESFHFLSSRRAPLWMYLIAVSFIGYFILLVHNNLLGPPEVGFSVSYGGGRMVLSEISPNSAAERAGLQRNDRVVTVEGQPVRNLADWQAITTNLVGGGTYRLEIERGKEQLESRLSIGTIPQSASWTAWDWEEFLTSRMTQLLDLLLALLIASRLPDDLAARVGAFFLATLAVSNPYPPYAFAAAIRQFPLPVSLLLWLVSISASLALPFFFVFCLVFPRPLLRGRLPWLLACLFAFALAPPAAYDAYYLVYRPDRLTGLLPDWFLQAVVLLALAYIVGGVLAMLANYRRLEDANDRRRVRVLLAGLGVAWLPAIPLILYLYLPAAAKVLRPYFSSHVSSVASIFYLAFPFSFAYAILRHRLFDIRVMVRRGLQYALSRRLVLSLVPGCGALLLWDLFEHRDQTISAVLQSRGWGYLLLASLAAVAHMKRVTWMEALDRRFFREHYDAQRLLREVVERVHQSDSVERVGPNVVAQIEAALHPEFAELLALDPQKRHYIALASAPVGHAPPPLASDSKLVALVRVLGKPLEVEPSESDWLQRQLPPEETDHLRRRRLGLLVPIATESNCAGALLALGVKRSEEPYSRDDKDLLVAIAASLAPLLEKSLKDLVALSRSVQSLAVEAASTKESASVRSFSSIGQNRWNWILGTVAVVAVLALVAANTFLHKRNAHALTERDTIVLADFVNSTGDAIFDGTLRQGLSVQLEQSPFLSIISDQQIQQTLSLMGQSVEAKLTPAIARELCQRTGSAAVLDGSIAQIGTQYLLMLKAVNCVSGESLASTEAQASDKNHVLDALGKTASEIRNKLGESLSTVQRFDTPLDQATTPSLEALKAFSSGARVAGTRGWAAAIPFFKRAVELDPNFALAYAYWGLGSTIIGEPTVGAVYTRTAYELRDRTSEPEKYLISTIFHKEVTGNIETAEQSCELWIQAYPRSPEPHSFLSGIIYPVIGQYEKAVEESREAIRLNPDDALSYGVLMFHYTALNRIDEAQAIYAQALKRKLDHPFFHIALNGIAFLQNDAAGIAQQLAWSAGKPGIEDNLLALEADTVAYTGRLREARELSRRAVGFAERAGQKETAASYSAVSGLREALFGNKGEARRNASLAMEHSTGRDVQYGSALTLAYAGDDKRARALTDDLGKRFPEDTVVLFNYLPTLRAKLALSRGNASEAIENLRDATPNELGQTTTSTYDWTALYPVYVRGEAYLATHRSNEAAAELQKILDHRGLVLNEPIAALSHLGLARAYAMQGDSAKAKGAYQDFLALWKDADLDIPILKQAKAEYAKLH